MTDSQAINNVNGYSEQQEEFHNHLCENKVHATGTPRMSQSDSNKVIDTVAHLDLMSQSEIDSNISPSLNSDSKLSQRPC